jgi:hypothetical protein
MSKLRSSVEALLAGKTSRGYQSFLAGPNPLVRPRTPVLAPAATLSEKIYRALKRDIIRGVYLPGEALGERDLTERYKGSRTPVREAAVRIQNERLLRIVPNRGYFVSPITLQILNKVYEFRAAVESTAAEGSGSHDFTRPAGLSKSPRSSETKGNLSVAARAADLE